MSKVRTPPDWANYQTKQDAAAEIRRIADLIENGEARMVKWSVSVRLWHTTEDRADVSLSDRRYKSGKTGRIEP